MFFSSVVHVLSPNIARLYKIPSFLIWEHTKYLWKYTALFYTETPKGSESMTLTSIFIIHFHNLSRNKQN